MSDMSVVQVLQEEIKDSELSLSRTNEESVYKRDLKKRSSGKLKGVITRW